MGSGGKRVTTRPLQRPVRMSSWMAVRMKLGGGPVSGVGMVSARARGAGVEPRRRARVSMILPLTKSLGAPATPEAAWDSEGPARLGARWTSILPGGNAMRIKSRHASISPSWPPSSSAVARADAQSPELAASFARATTALYEMINVPDGNGHPPRGPGQGSRRSPCSPAS